jgi:hypothetical protein
MGNEDWERWPQPRDRTRWKAEVRDVWVPWLRGCSHGTMVLANDSAYWTRLGMADNGVTFWVSGLNVVSDMVLCKLHDEFVVVDEVIHV